MDHQVIIAVDHIEELPVHFPAYPGLIFGIGVEIIFPAEFGMDIEIHLLLDQHLKDLVANRFRADQHLAHVGSQVDQKKLVGISQQHFLLPFRGTLFIAVGRHHAIQRPLRDVFYEICIDQLIHFIGFEQVEIIQKGRDLFKILAHDPADVIVLAQEIQALLIDLFIFRDQNPRIHFHDQDPLFLR